VTTEPREFDAYETWSTVVEPAPESTDHYRWPTPPDSSPDRLPWMSWLYSLALPVALWLILVTVFLQIRSESNLITFAVTDDSTGLPIPNAELIVETSIYRADENGEVTIRPPAVGSTIFVQAEGYRAVRGSFLDGASRQQRVSLREATLIGTVVDGMSGDPVVGARVFVTDTEGNVGSQTSTEESGDFRLVRLPENAILHVEADGFTSASIQIGSRESLTVTLLAMSSSRAEELDTVASDNRALRSSSPPLQPAGILPLDFLDG
jgi:hypothetical protein